MKEQSHRKADPAPTPAIRTTTPTGAAPVSKPTRDKGTEKPEARPTDEE